MLKKVINNFSNCDIFVHDITMTEYYKQHLSNVHLSPFLFASPVLDVSREVRGARLPSLGVGSRLGISSTPRAHYAATAVAPPGFLASSRGCLSCSHSS